MVGITGIKPVTFCSQSRRATSAPHPEEKSGACPLPHNHILCYWTLRAVSETAFGFLIDSAVTLWGGFCTRNAHSRFNIHRALLHRQSSFEQKIDRLLEEGLFIDYSFFFIDFLSPMVCRSCEWSCLPISPLMLSHEQNFCASMMRFELMVRGLMLSPLLCYQLHYTEAL